MNKKIRDLYFDFKSIYRKTVFAFLFFLFGYSFIYAQVVTSTPALSSEENLLLDNGRKWIDENLKCKQFSQNNYHVPDFKKAPIGKCSELNQKVFGHFDSSGSLGLILGVNGGNWMAPNGTFIGDEKFVYCNFSNGNFLGKAFTERNKESNLELISFKSGPDLVLIRDPQPYTEGSSASVYSIVKGEMKEVLKYDYVSVCHQCIGGFETNLIPQENRDLVLITLSIDEDVGDGRENYFGLVTAHVFRKVYSLNPFTDLYQTNGISKELPLISGVYNWFHSEPSPEIFDNTENLEELIGYLKLDKNDPRRKFAHDILQRIARKDLGDDFELWEKWKLQLTKDNPKDDSDN